MNWYKLSERKPACYKSGGWDGLKSDKILVCTTGGKLYVAEAYSGTLDGNEFFDFYDDRDFDLPNVEYWTEIDMPY